MRPDSPLARRAAVRVSDLRAAPLIVMRAGYLMHRFVHRLLHEEVPPFSCSADGSEMGKLMVAEGLGVTVLPDFSVIATRWSAAATITWRPLAGDQTQVRLVLLRPRSGSPPRAVQDLHQIFVDRARATRTGRTPLTRRARFRRSRPAASGSAGRISWRQGQLAAGSAGRAAGLSGRDGRAGQEPSQSAAWPRPARPPRDPAAQLDRCLGEGVAQRLLPGRLADVRQHPLAQRQAGPAPQDDPLPAETG